MPLPSRSLDTDVAFESLVKRASSIATIIGGRTMSNAPKQRGRLRRWFRASLAVLAVGYPVALLIVLLALRFISEDWWVTAVGLYLPRVGFALPLPAIALGLALTRRWRWLALQIVSLWLMLFPLMGLVVSWRSYPADGERSFRILSFNVDSGSSGFQPLVDEIISHSPDIVVIQELPDWRAQQMKTQLSPFFANISARDQFFVASKFPIVSSDIPPGIPFFGRLRSPRFMRFVLETPLGKVTIYNLHTVSPRGGFLKMRGQGLRREILSGRIVQGQASPEIESTAALRALQVKATAAMADRESGPVMIVGDTNLPTLSDARARYLGHYHDGFAEAGLGFGYTFPAKWPWMRIDLLLTSEELEFKRVETGKGRASDHVCVFGDVVRRKHGAT